MLIFSAQKPNFFNCFRAYGYIILDLFPDSLFRCSMEGRGFLINTNFYNRVGRNFRQKKPRKLAIKLRFWDLGHKWPLMCSLSKFLEELNYLGSHSDGAFAIRSFSIL